MNAEVMLTLFIAVPLITAFLTPFLGLLHRGIPQALTVAVTLFLVVLACFQFRLDPVSYAVGGWLPPFGINLVGDPLTRLFHLVIAVISFLVSIYSISYIGRYTDTARFFTLFLLMVAGMNGVVASGDLFNIFVFLEISAISSYALVAFGIEREELEASFKYLVLGGIGSTFVLLGIALLYNQTGTLNIADNARAWGPGGSEALIYFTAALFIVGFGLKAAIVPFHAWLPDAHSSAPAPISAMLSGLLIKTLGIYCFLRVFFIVFGTNVLYLDLFRWLGLISMTVGALLAMGQDDFKRLLAYSSVSQMGYIIFGIGLGTPLGILGGLLHLVNHAVFKSLLFLCSGAVEFATGTRNIRELGGLWKKMPATAAACTAGSLSISGIPPFGGFFSKLIIIIATLSAADTLGPAAYWYTGVLVIVSFITLAYFVKLQKWVFFGNPGEQTAHAHEVPAGMWVAQVSLALLTLALGIALPWVIGTLIEPARSALLDVSGYINLVMGSLP